jgi:hypothetical protein
MPDGFCEKRQVGRAIKSKTGQHLYIHVKEPILCYILRGSFSPIRELWISVCSENWKLLIGYAAT